MYELAQIVFVGGTPDTFVKGGLKPLDSLLFVTKDDTADAAAVRSSGRQDHRRVRRP